MTKTQYEKKELSHSENIQQAAKVVEAWLTWKIQNMRAVFSEPDIKVPGNIQRKFPATIEVGEMKMNDNCDSTIGPCSCGAWHTEEEIIPSLSREPEE